MATIAERGHRVLPGTAGCIVEAWAPSKPECLAQAVRALVGAFADTSSVVTTETLTLVLPPAPGDEQLSGLLEQVLELRALLQVIPVDIALAETDDGGLAGCVDVAALAVVHPTQRVRYIAHAQPQASMRTT